LLVDAVNIVRNVCVQTYLLGYPILRNNHQIIKIYKLLVLDSLKKLIAATGIDLKKLIKTSLKVLTKDDHLLEQDGATVESSKKKLQHVDMIFRLYLPLFALFNQTNYLVDC